MIKQLSILVLLPLFSYASEPELSARAKLAALPDELAVSITKTRLEYLSELTREFRATCGRLPQSVESFFEPDLDSCPQFPRLTTAYTLLDGWDRTFNLVSRGQGAYIVSYGADGKEGGLSSNRDLIIQVEGL